MSRLMPTVPRAVWVLGFVSMFMDISSEIVHALLPLFMTGTLGLSVATVGLVDGIAEATASISKVFSGYISDRTRRRKPLVVFGYGLGALSKPFFAVANGALPILGARFADRVGKGIRGAPRDAMVADACSPEIRGRAFGLRQSLDTVGAFAGPLIAVGLMLLLANDMRLVFWIAVIPATIAVALAIFGLKEEATPPDTRAALPVRMTDLRRLDRPFWTVVLVGVLFSLARISEAFLILRASDLGLSLAFTPLVLVLMNVIYSAGAYPAGIVSDRVSPPKILLGGMIALVASHLVLAYSSGLIGVALGVALWGIHMALTQGILSRMVADRAPAPLIGSAFGIFNLVTGVALLLASLTGGVLWDMVGPKATFLVAAGFAAASTALMFAARAARQGAETR